MKPATLSVAAVVAIALLGVAAAQTNITGTRFMGYTYASNVLGYANMSTDYCDILAAVRAGNWTEAASIYSSGKNSFSGITRRSFFRFATYAPGSAEYFHDALTMGRNTTWLDTMIKSAISATNAPLFLGLLQVATLKYMMHEVDEAGARVANYAANNTLVSEISDAEGAPHSIDEAWAMWTGGKAGACDSLWAWADKVGADMGTTFIGRSYTNLAMTIGINDQQGIGRIGDQASMDRSRAQIVRYVTALGLQGVAHGAYKAQVAAECKRPTADVDAAKASIQVYWTYLHPLLVARNTPAATVNSLERALKAVLADKTPNATNAVKAARDAAVAMGLLPAEAVGTPIRSAFTAGWSCRA